MSVAVLYICYQSILEPLTETQVVAYLAGLAASDYRIHLLTFEPKRLDAKTERSTRARLAASGIGWRRLRYHKRPSVAATAWDTIAGCIYGLWMAYRCDIRLIHARSHVPALMAIVIQALSRTRVLFDVRGLLAEEYADAGVWRADGFLFRLTKRMERVLMGRADGVVTLTERGRKFLMENYPRELRDKPLSLIPCCVDLRRTTAMPARAPHPLRVVYVGKFGGWYLDRELFRFVAAAQKSIPGLRFEIKTQSPREDVLAEVERHGLAAITGVEQIPPEDVIPALRETCDVALCFIKPCVSKLASSPTKVGEYLAAGLGVVVNAGIGDLDALVESERIGVVVEGFTETAFHNALERLVPLVSEPGFRERCRAVAAKYLSLESVGWPRYREMYRACTIPSH